MGHPVISLAFTKGKRDGDHENGNVSKQGWKEGGVGGVGGGES